MNIVFFTHYVSLYGANRSLINLADGLAIKGFNVFLVAPNHGPITEYFISKNFPCFIHPFQYFFIKEKPSKVLVLQRLKHLIDNLSTIIQQIKKWDADIIYTNSSVIDIGLLCAKAINKPHIWHVREFGDLDYGYTPDIGKSLFRRLLCTSEGVIFISNILKQYVLPKHQHNNLSIIYNGVATKNFISEFYRNNKKNTKKEIINFSIVGQVLPTKGQHIAISSFINVLEKFPKSKLFVGGRGTIIPHLKKIVFDNKLYDNILFLGEIIEPLGLFMNTDVALMCSENEAMGRVTAEAMSCACPVIGSRKGANPELINHGHTGYLYDTPDDLSNFMIKMIENPIETRNMGNKAIETALQRFTIEQYTDNVINVINSVSNTKCCDHHTNAIEDDFLNNNDLTYYNIYKNLLNI